MYFQTLNPQQPHLSPFKIIHQYSIFGYFYYGIGIFKLRLHCPFKVYEMAPPQFTKVSGWGVKRRFETRQPARCDQCRGKVLKLLINGIARVCHEVLIDRFKILYKFTEFM